MSPDSKPRIGFIGLGVMGCPMAGHLAKAGYSLTVYDLDAATARRVAESNPGASVAASPKAVGQQSDIVVTMLPNGRIVQQIALAENGLIEGFARGAILLDTSSAEPWLTEATAKALAARGIEMVDAPVSGAQWGAQAAELVFMVGGAADPVAQVMPLLNILGRAVFHLGPLGSGHAMKCINNTITAMTFLATAEGLAVGKRFGLDPVVMNQVLNEATGMSWITQNHIGQRILSRTFDDPFKLDLMVKDIAIAMELGRSNDLPLPFSTLGQQLYKAAALQAGEGRSLSELARWVERMTGVEITPGSER